MAKKKVGNPQIAAWTEEKIIEWCEKNNQLEWLYTASTKKSKRKRKDGTSCDITFLELRKLFITKFFPGLYITKPEVIPDNFRTRIATKVAEARASGK